MPQKKQGLRSALLRVALAGATAWLAAGAGACRSAPQVEVGPPRHLDRRVLEESIALGRRHLLNAQFGWGNFVYEYHFVAGIKSRRDSGVRQCGALWALALLHWEEPTEETGKAVLRGLGFFRRNSHPAAEGGRLVRYPRASLGHTNTMALLCLACIDYLRADAHVTERETVEEDLEGYLRFLMSLRREDGHFYGRYSRADGRGVGSPSPYADGEALLALVKAARYAGRDDLRELALRSAESMYNRHVKSALAGGIDSDYTKGFYQWGSMAFYEIHRAGWDPGDRFAGRTIRMAHWMIDIHQVLFARANTAYAHEGLAVAWELARRTGDAGSMRKIEHVINASLLKLISWQIAGPCPNAYLRARPTDDPLAVGGVLNTADNPVLRIDVTQHQVNAMLLVRRLLLRDRRSLAEPAPLP